MDDYWVELDACYASLGLSGLERDLPDAETDLAQQAEQEVVPQISGVTGPQLLSALEPDRLSAYEKKLMHVVVDCERRMEHVKRRSCIVYYQVPAHIQLHVVYPDEREKIMNELVEELNTREGIRAVMAREKPFTICVSWAPGSGLVGGEVMSG